jgi:5-methylcytosine-specific restriction endonuclease McrA
LSRPELGPTNRISNILPACRPCNARKGNRTESEYRQWLRRPGVARPRVAKRS